jgi:hypothetical protein
VELFREGLPDSAENFGPKRLFLLERLSGAEFGEGRFQRILQWILRWEGCHSSAQFVQSREEQLILHEPSR